MLILQILCAVYGWEVVTQASLSAERFDLRHPCHTQGREESTDSGGAAGCKPGALGPVSLARPTHSSRYTAVPCGGGCRGRGMPFEAMGNLMPGDPNWQICVLWKIKSALSTYRQLISGRDLFIVWRGGPFILLMALHLIAPGTNGKHCSSSGWISM